MFEFNTLQIRLPDGRALREKFSAEAKLQDVWDFVETKVKDLNNFILMQVSKSSVMGGY